MKLIAITGGIGSGKSVVARMAEVMGYHVYDCDSRAKALMVTDDEVKRLLVDAFGNETYLEDGTINRQYLSTVAFSNEAARARLNGIVHPATERDLQKWADCRRLNGDTILFVETALLRTAGLDKIVDEVWHVTAPDNVRVERVMRRSGLSEEQARARMAAQVAEDSIADGEFVLVNNGEEALLPQFIKLLSCSQEL